MTERKPAMKLYVTGRLFEHVKAAHAEALDDSSLPYMTDKLPEFARQLLAVGLEEWRRQRGSS